MAVRRDDTWERPLLTERAIEIAAQIESRIRLEQNLLDRVSAAVDPAEHFGMDRRLLGRRQQTGAGQDLLAQKRRLLEPRFPSLEHRHLEMRVHVGSVGIP